MADSPACQLFQRSGTLEHILSCCPKALGNVRYRWHHDQILRAIADTITAVIQSSKSQHPSKHTISFVRAGEKAQQQPRSLGGLLANARDWNLQVDLGSKLKFINHITATSLHPDMVLTSESTRQVVIGELIVPWEDRLEETNEHKRAKYAELVEECRSGGWKARSEPVEVGCQGFAGQLLLRTLKLLGVKSQLCRRAMKNISEAAEKASRGLWIWRGDLWSSMPLGHRPGTDHPRQGRFRYRGFLFIKDPKHPLTSGLSLMTCPSSTRRCMLESYSTQIFSLRNTIIHQKGFFMFQKL